MSKQLIALIFATFIVTGAVAGEASDPSGSIRAKTQLVLAGLSAHQQRPDSASDQAMARLRSNLGTVLAPIIDMDSAALLLLGRQWKDASSGQRARFKSALSAMLMSTYTSTLAQAGGISIEVLEAKPAGRAGRATVPARVTLEGGRELRMVYKMRERDAAWKIYDIALDGVSLLKTYRPAMRSALQRDGMDGLIASMEAKYGVQS
jgi:phospholipid transport system substrate-binding protein